MKDAPQRGRNPRARLTRRAFMRVTAERSLALGGLSPLVFSGCSAVSSRKGSVARSKDKGRPNVIFILTDDHRWDQLGCEGHPFLKTPHLDRVAAEGARFANMFVTTSLCSPSRASFLSGLYAHSHGVVNNFTDYPEDLPSFRSGPDSITGSPTKGRANTTTRSSTSTAAEPSRRDTTRTG